MTETAAGAVAALNPTVLTQDYAAAVPVLEAALAEARAGAVIEEQAAHLAALEANVAAAERDLAHARAVLAAETEA
jgi:hypothetical protein